jgi:hypothetical protein
VDNNPRDSPGRTPRTRPALISRYRTDDEIRAILEELCARAADTDERGRLHVLVILDDLAEEMIGRRQADPNLTVRIRAQRVRWAGTASPIIDPSGP